MIRQMKPQEIEEQSFLIIQEELDRRGIVPDPEQAPVIRRAIHASADFDYAETLTFSPNAVSIAQDLIRSGADIVTDTNMALAGIHRKLLSQYGGDARCLMADPEVAREASERGVTRASVSMERAAEEILESGRKTIFAVGNAPTALVTLHTLMRVGLFTPDFIIGVPVGFVNVEEAKELILTSSVPHIVNRGRKGGSSVAAAIINALLHGMKE